MALIVPLSSSATPYTNPSANHQLRVVSDSKTTTIYGKRYHLDGAVQRKISMLLPKMFRSTKEDGVLSKMKLYYEDLFEYKLEIPATERSGACVVHELCIYFNYRVVEHLRTKNNYDRWLLYHKG